jgi:hypothetical protein
MRVDDGHGAISHKILRREPTRRFSNYLDTVAREELSRALQPEVCLRIMKVLLLLICSTALLFGETKSRVVPNPAFDKMKTLVGSWEGSAEEGGQQIPTNARFQLISLGSALMGWLGERTSDEMGTMFHPDGDDLMATHYCAAHNQPRMVLVRGGDPNKLVFKFKDGTNIDPETGHMNQVVFIFDQPDHHVEEWTYLEKGKQMTGRFDFHRTR